MDRRSHRVGWMCLTIFLAAGTGSRRSASGRGLQRLVFAGVPRRDPRLGGHRNSRLPAESAGERAAAGFSRPGGRQSGPVAQPHSTPAVAGRGSAATYHGASGRRDHAVVQAGPDGKPASQAVPAAEARLSCADPGGGGKEWIYAAIERRFERLTVARPKAAALAVDVAGHEELGRGRGDLTVTLRNATAKPLIVAAARRVPLRPGGSHPGRPFRGPESRGK